MNIDNLTTIELIKLKEQIETKIDTNKDFWSTITILEKLDEKRNQIDNEIIMIKENQKQIEELEKLGYSIVIYNKKRVGLINYTKEKKENFHGCSFIQSNNKLDFENFEKPTENDISKIEEILFEKYKKIAFHESPEKNYDHTTHLLRN